MSAINSSATDLQEQRGASHQSTRDDTTATITKKWNITLAEIRCWPAVLHTQDTDSKTMSAWLPFLAPLYHNQLDHVSSPSYKTSTGCNADKSHTFSQTVLTTAGDNQLFVIFTCPCLEKAYCIHTTLLFQIPWDTGFSYPFLHV